MSEKVSVIVFLKVNITAEKKLKRMACFAHASQLHFSDVSTPAKLLLRLNHEYWTLAGRKK